VACLFTLLYITPVLAIADPDAISINGVWVYRNCREEGDQLYIVDYTIDYTVNPDENVAEAYLCRLMDEDDDELRAVAPVAYYDDGYGDGVVSIYFEADDAPTWEEDYTMMLAGNPFLEWAGDPPSDEVTEFDIWQDNEIGVTKLLVAARVIDLALGLETDWGEDMVSVTDEGDQVLTTYGLGYFLNVILYFSDIAPTIFPEGQGMQSGVITPELPEEDFTKTDYSDELETNIIGTPFDLSAMATTFGGSRGAWTAILYYGCVVGVLILIARRIGTYKPMMLLSIPFVILGAFIGVPLIATIVAGLMALGMTAYTIFYKPSTA